MNSNEKHTIVVNGIPHTKQIILADVNIPYKFSLDRNKNTLFFCINADEFSDQSFQSVKLDLDTGVPTIVPSIRNGFASAVDHLTGRVYLGGSEGVYKYSYQLEDIEKPAIVSGVDVFDMFFKNELYYVDTTNLDLHVFKNSENSIIDAVQEYGIHHFTIDANDNFIFANPTGLFMLEKGKKTPESLCVNFGNVRSITSDVHGLVYVITQNGIYFLDQGIRRLIKIMSLENGYGLAFDRDNNIVYGEERFVAKLKPLT